MSVLAKFKCDSIERSFATRYITPRTTDRFPSSTKCGP